MSPEFQHLSPMRSCFPALARDFYQQNRRRKLHFFAQRKHRTSSAMFIYSITHFDVSRIPETWKFPSRCFEIRLTF
jgi:hypothetical protein